MYKQTFLTQDKTNRRQRDKGLFGEKKKKRKKEGVNTKRRGRAMQGQQDEKISYTLLMSVPAPSSCF